MKITFAIILYLLSSYALYGATLSAIYIDTPPKIDGKIEEDVWQKAAIVSDLVQ